MALAFDRFHATNACFPTFFLERPLFKHWVLSIIFHITFIVSQQQHRTTDELPLSIIYLPSQKCMKCWDIDQLYNFKNSRLAPLKIKRPCKPPCSFGDHRWGQDSRFGPNALVSVWDVYLLTVGFKQDMNSGLLSQSPPPPPLYVDFFTLCTTSPC